MENATRNFVKMIKEICKEEDIKIKSFSHDWIFCLNKDNKNHYIYGYQFGLNLSSINSILNDKSAASEIMSYFNIPHIEHYFFMSPANQKYIAKVGNWKVLLERLEEYGQLICKANEGSEGDLIYKVSNEYELENAVYKIFQKAPTMAVSPYYDIENEYRTIVLDGKIKLIYSKQRAHIVGDGIHSVNSLIFKYLSNEGTDYNIKLKEKDLNRVLDKGESLILNWKHNLSQGSKAVIEQNNRIKMNLESIVNLVIDKLNIKFASIDIVKCHNEYKVLEINSGVMMEHFSRQSNETYTIAKEIYREAILKMFCE